MNEFWGHDADPTAQGRIQGAKPVAVLDIGKTNLKVLIFDAAGNVVAERAEANAPLPPDAACPYLHLDTSGVWRFLAGALKELSARQEIEAISLTTHGGAGVLVGERDVAMPAMDYETDALEADFNRQNHALAAQLEKVGAKHLTTNFYGPGTHGWAYWQRELHASLPMLLQALHK